MTAISDLVAYEREFKLDLHHPGNEKKKIGVTFWVKHIDCQAATEAIKASAAQVFDENADKDPWAVVAACVSRWDWGGMEFEAGKGELKFTPENVRYVFNHPNAKWIVAQVRGAVTKIQNFTTS